LFLQQKNAVFMRLLAFRKRLKQVSFLEGGTHMDQITHSVRRSNWLGIIKQCQERPEGISVRQWLADNSIREKSYYYWLRKFRKEAYEEMQAPPSETQQTEITFAELPVPPKMLTDLIVPDEIQGAVHPAAVIRTGGITIEVSNDISEALLTTILREVPHA
jgi:putative transposase